MARPSLFEIEAAIIKIINEIVGNTDEEGGIKVVVRDADFDITKTGWQSVLVPDVGEDVHAIVVSVIEYPQRRTGSDKVIDPTFGIDFIRQYQLSADQRKAFYDEFELVSDKLSAKPDLGMNKQIAGHDELQGSNIGTRTIVGVKLRVLPTMLKVRLHPVDLWSIQQEG